MSNKGRSVGLRANVCFALGDRKNHSFAEAISKTCLLRLLQQASLSENIEVLDDKNINSTNLVRSL